MSDFVYWNIVTAIIYFLYLIVRRILPTSKVFVVVSRSRSTMYGRTAVILVNDRRSTVFRTGPLWRFRSTGEVLPEEWQDILDE